MLSYAYRSLSISLPLKRCQICERRRKASIHEVFDAAPDAVCLDVGDICGRDVTRQVGIFGEAFKALDEDEYHTLGQGELHTRPPRGD